ncbi:MAG: NERD domain-containing protein, partial [Myxococcota bacterium]
EERVWRALRKALPEGWAAYHSLRLRTQNGFEGEGDFVLACPTRGLLVLEVKGGRIELRGGHWWQNGKKLHRSPRAQAQGYVRQLVDELERRCGERPPFGVACVFPDCAFTEAPTSGDLFGLVLGEQELSYLEEALPPLLARALPPGARAPKSPRWLRELHELWGETWLPSVELPGALHAASQRLLSLDRHQLEVLQLFEANARAVVRGGAGSGKTVLARELCVRRARRGEKALYLCFTDALAGAVDESFAKLRAQGLSLEAKALRRYARQLVAQRQPDFDESNPEAWSMVSLQAALDALPHERERPAWVVVDEGQDFEPSDWDLIEELSRGRGLWVFHDPGQRFWRDREVPTTALTGAAVVQLPAQWRNPPLISALAQEYRRRAGEGIDVDETNAVISDLVATRDEEVLQVIVCDEDPLARVTHELNELIRQGIPPSAIAIVSLAGQTKSELLGKERLGSHRLVPADDPHAGAHIVMDTFLRFKGLERPVVLVVEVEAGRSSVYETRMYIALTRATVSARVFCLKERLSEDPLLSAWVDA